jgi:hypothetical protein
MIKRSKVHLHPRTEFDSETGEPLHPQAGGIDDPVILWSDSGITRPRINAGYPSKGIYIGRRYSRYEPIHRSTTQVYRWIDPEFFGGRPKPPPQFPSMFERTLWELNYWNICYRWAQRFWVDQIKPELLRSTQHGPLGALHDFEHKILNTPNNQPLTYNEMVWVHKQQCKKMIAKLIEKLSKYPKFDRRNTPLPRVSSYRRLKLGAPEHAPLPPPTTADDWDSEDDDD